MPQRAEPHAGRGRLRLPGRRARAKFLFFPVVGYNEDNHDIIRDLLTRPGDAARAVGRRRALRPDLRCRAADLDADALGARPHARAGPAAGASRQAADQRDGRFLRLPRPRPARARPAGRRQRDRLRPAAPAPARDRATTCRPAAAVWCSASTATSRRWSPARRSSSTARTPAPAPAASCATGDRIGLPPAQDRHLY